MSGNKSGDNNQIINLFDRLPKKTKKDKDNSNYTHDNVAIETYMRITFLEHDEYIDLHYDTHDDFHSLTEEGLQEFIKGVNYVLGNIKETMKE